jgi:hypothetical protein
MTDHDTGEIPISTQTIQQIDAGITELRVQDGLLVDSRMFSVDNIQGVQSVTIGDSERGQFVMISQDSQIGGPFMRDIFIIDPSQPKHYRVNIELDDEEREVIEHFEACLRAWQKILVEQDPFVQAEEIERLQRDSESFNRVLLDFKDVADSRDLGDITEEEAETRFSAMSLHYSSYESEDPETAAYEAAYSKSAQALINFLAVTLHVDKKLDMVTAEIIDGDGEEFSTAAMPLGEARAWTLLGVLDRLAGSNKAA